MRYARRSDILIALWFLLGFSLSCIILTFTALTQRYELQNIDQRSEQRYWFAWSKEGLRRLNPAHLWRYHEQHDQPCDIAHWDYTVSWLLSANVRPPEDRFVIFNRLPEDDPPAEAIAQMPWLKPLAQQTIPRATVAEWITFLRRCGAKAIVLDYDFSSPSQQDAALAKELVNAKTGRDGIPAIPVYFVRGVTRESASRLNIIERTSEPSSLKAQLQNELGKACDLDDFCGTSVLLPDDDQVIRRCLLRSDDANGEEHKSIVALTAAAIRGRTLELGQDVVDINFIDGARSEFFPVRPLTYLLDPQRRTELLTQDNDRDDVRIKDAIVLLGDGVDDLFNTSMTHGGLMQMSGTEVIAHAINTVVSKSMPGRTDERFDGVRSLLASLVSGFFASLIWLLWRMCARNIPHRVLALRLIGDAGLIVFMVAAVQLCANILFAQLLILVPVVTPAISICVGALMSTLAERNMERDASYQTQIAMRETEHKLEVQRLAAEAEARRFEEDRRRRSEFVRRINHDLNAPLTVLNWTVYELNNIEQGSEEMRENVGVLVSTSNRLCMLLDEMSRSYEHDDSLTSQQIDVKAVLQDSVTMLAPLANATSGRIECHLPECALPVRADTASLSRVIDNLVRNAFRHNPKGTVVQISARVIENGIAMSINDNGSGISETYWNSIFLSENNNHNGRGGHGMGLKIVKSIVEKIGGKVMLVPKAGEGTHIQLILPIVERDKIQMEVVS